MDKISFYRLAGRDLGLRFVVAMSPNDKTASAEQIEQMSEIEAVHEYSDELQKIAYRGGVLEGYDTVLKALESGMQPAKIAAFLKSAMDEGLNTLGPKEAPAEEGAEEIGPDDVEAHLVMGVAESIGAALNQDPESPEIIQAAVEVVHNELSETADEEAEPEAEVAPTEAETPVQ